MRQKHNPGLENMGSGFIPAVAHGLDMLKDRFTESHTVGLETKFEQSCFLRREARESGQTVSIFNAGHAIKFETAQAF